MGPLAHLADPPAADAGGLAVRIADATVVARPSGLLWVPGERLLAVADLHLGKAGRLARRGGALLPPFETADTLARLGAEIAALQPRAVVCVGDSFDDAHAAASLSGAERAALADMANGRVWVWVSGNHDPRPPGLGGIGADTWQAGGLSFRHIADGPAMGEVSGHFHPKATVALRGRRVARRCFVHDRTRLILPAFGTYAGGLDVTDRTFDALLDTGAWALLLGRRVTAVPRAALAVR